MIWHTPYTSDPHLEPFTNYYDIFQQERYGNVLTAEPLIDMPEEEVLSTSEVSWIEQQLSDPFTESIE